MAKRVKIFSLVLSLLLFFTISSPIQISVYADSVNGISVSKNELIQGETFTVSLNIPSLDNADTASLRIEFDSDIFEVVSDVSSWSDLVSNGNTGSGDGYIALSAGNSSRRINLNSGLTLSASLKVKTTAPNGNYNINLVKHSLSYTENGVDYVELWNPTTKTVSEKIGADDTYPKTAGGINVSKNEVKRNEEFTASIVIPAMNKKANTASLKAEFNQNVFEVTSWTASISGGEPNYGEGFFSVSAANANASIDLNGGLTLTAHIKAKSNAEIGDYSFNLTKYSISYVDDDGISNIEMWTPVNTAASIKVIPDIPTPVVLTTGGGISASKTTLTHDEQFTVSINIPQMADADTTSLRVEFDVNEFEVTEWNPSISGGEPAYGDGYFGVSASNATRKINLTNGLTLTAKLKVKSNASKGNYSFTLSKYSISYVDDADGYTNINLWNPSTKTVSVTVSNTPISITRGGGITLSKSQVKQGDSFTATVTIPKISTKADTASIRVEFDSNVFEVTSWKPNITGGTPGSGSGYFSISASNSTQVIDLSSGLSLTANIKVKSNAANGSYSFKLSRSSILYVDSTGTSQELWNPSTTSASIKVSSGTDFTPVSGGGISLSHSEIYAGDQFVVYVTVPTISAYADTASIRVEFDQNSFDVVSWNPNVTGGVPTFGNGYFSLSASNTGKYIDLSRGMTLSATLRAKTGANTGSYDFKLVRGSFSFIKDNSNYSQEMWNPVTTTAYLRIVNRSTYTTSSNGSWIPPVITSTTTTTTTQSVSIQPSDDDDNNGDKNVKSDDDDDDNNDTTKPIVNISLESELEGLVKGKIRTSSKRKFFNSDTIIILRNTDNAEKMANKALRQLKMSNHEYYAFDISLYDTATGRYISSLNNGYIEFNIPLPRNLKSVPNNIGVYHIANGVPEFINSSIIVEDGQQKIHFSTNSFSPYMFVDVVNEKEDNVVIPANNVIPDNTGSSKTYSGGNGSGNANPNTGVAAAIVIPGSLAGCVYLASKDKQRRKRSKRR